MRIHISGRDGDIIVEEPARLVEGGDTWMTMLAKAVKPHANVGDVVVVNGNQYFAWVKGITTPILRRLLEINYTALTDTPATLVKELYGFQVYADKRGYLYVPYIDRRGHTCIDFFESVEEYNKKFLF
jgi:hypothetical protein